MKALKIIGYGKIGKNLEFQDCSIPIVGEFDVLIKVKAASINPVDYKTVLGLTRIIQKINFPAAIGYDVSGVVFEVGEKVTQFKKGDEVFARVDTNRPGTLAEYAVTSESTVALKPQNCTFEEAASFPLVALTTVQAFETGKIQSGNIVLIHAGSGGIGSFAIQYAKSLGAIVYTTTSNANVQWVKSLGADVVIDYKTQNYLELVPSVDMVYDTLGNKFTLDAFKILKQGGSVVNIAGPIVDKESADELNFSGLLKAVFWLLRIPVNRLVRKKTAHYKFLLMKPIGRQLEMVKGLIEQEKIKPVIDTVLPFEQSIEALQKLATSRAKGKIVIKVS